MIKRLGAFMLGVGLVLFAATGALAAQLTVNDDVKDNMEPGLDIVKASVSNRDRAVVVTVFFRKDRLGDVVVAVKTRNHGAVGLAVKHRSGPDKLFFLTRHDGVKCPRLRFDWLPKEAAVQFRMPSRCLNDGNYGAIKTWVLTEGAHGGGDTDYAPVRNAGQLKYSRWISRG
jgi:hypothetical protein